MTMPHDYDPAAEPVLHVHIASAEPGALTGAPAAPAKYRTVYRTIHLTAKDNGKELWAASDNRVCAYVQALDDDITISKSSGDAVDGEGATLPKANTAPTPIQDSAVAFAGNATGTFSGGSSTYSRVSVIAVYRA